MLAELTSTKTGIGPEGPGKSRSWLSKLNGVDDYAPGEQRIDRGDLNTLAANAIGGAMNVWLRQSDRGFAKIVNPMPFSGYGSDNASPAPVEYLAAQRAARTAARAASEPEAQVIASDDVAELSASAAATPAATPRAPAQPRRRASAASGSRPSAQVGSNQTGMRGARWRAFALPERSA